MASNDTENEKPNLRPIKHTSANGRSIFLHHNPRQPSNKSYIQATEQAIDQNDLFGIQQPNIEYSLNKQNRWEILENIQENRMKFFSDGDFDTSSDSDQSYSNDFHLHQHHHIKHGANYITITNRKQQKSLSNSDNNTTTYIAVVPTSHDKQITNIRSYGGKNKKRTTTTNHHLEFNTYEDDLDDDSELNETENEQTPSNDISSKPNPLQLTDFVSLTSKKSQQKKSSYSNRKLPITKENTFERKLRYYQQKSQEKSNSSFIPTKFLPNKLKTVSLTYQTVSLYQPDFTIENLSNIYKKNFLHAQCSPIRYILCLTDRLKSLGKKFDCYLIIIILNNQDNICQAQITLNFHSSIEINQIENLNNEQIYKHNQLIENILQFLLNLSSNVFQLNEFEWNRKSISNNSNLNEYEIINQQIDQINLLEEKNLIKSTINNIQANICTSCYSDIDESILTTTLNTCQHCFCNTCWKEYLENSIKTVQLIHCPEWNCNSIVDIGTMLSLVNIRYVNIYKLNLDKCLVNMSNSHVKCPLNSCYNIVQIFGMAIDKVRCRCGFQFCIDCKEEPHFPACCSAYRSYIDQAQRNGDFITQNFWRVRVDGRNCISCNDFIEKNGGCNHMTCRCGAQFCWACGGQWKGHTTCLIKPTKVQTVTITKTRNIKQRYYYNAISHRFQRSFENQTKQNENVKRLIGTIRLDKLESFDSILLEKQIKQREQLLQHAYEIVKYISYLHRICEYIAVAADGHGNTLPEYENYFAPFEGMIIQLNQVLENGKGYQAIDELHRIHQTSEKLIEKLRQAVFRRRTNNNGYMTS